MNYVFKDSMDEEMENMKDLVADEASFSNEIDFEYEFDANQFFDFTVDETESEAEEAETWFRFACEHPPSPFIVKLKMMKEAKANKTSSRKKEADKKNSTSSTSDDIDNHKASSREVKIKGVKHHNHIPQDTTKEKSKSTFNLSKPNGSSFMKPTASHLAKQTKECDIHSGGGGRLQKSLVSAVEKLQSPIKSQNQATKRQKLEIGYLRKAAQLKHRALFLHKVTKKAAHLEDRSKSKITTLRKPALVTEERAQRHG
ncbi:uncharacterized protein [Rutidosis leptorrhynchoides]|uniref:uncharacterized protein isoform X1 n=1 Tax=Rutidosis leptorrhynchoides TaxID=125765 RepID=UPI003A9A5187